MAQSAPGQEMPRPSPTQKVPNAESRIPTTKLETVFRDARERAMNDKAEGKHNEQGRESAKAGRQRADRHPQRRWRGR